MDIKLIKIKGSPDVIFYKVRDSLTGVCFTKKAPNYQKRRLERF